MERMPFTLAAKHLDCVQKAKNFSMEDMKEGIAFAHEHGVKVYVTANILAHNRDLEGVEEYFRELKK